MSHLFVIRPDLRTELLFVSQKTCTLVHSRYLIAPSFFLSHFVVRNRAHSFGFFSFFVFHRYCAVDRVKLCERIFFLFCLMLIKKISDTDKSVCDTHLFILPNFVTLSGRNLICPLT
jgi:hypothetical protein